MNRTSEYALTIVVPVFNEEDNIHNLEKALTEFIPVSKVKTCALFVDDGSKDGSLKLIQEVCSRNKDIFYISFSKNAGLSAAIYAVRAGLDVHVLYKDDGALGKADRIENYFGFPDVISGAELLSRGRAQAERLGARMHRTEVTGIE